MLLDKMHKEISACISQTGVLSFHDISEVSYPFFKIHYECLGYTEVVLTVKEGPNVLNDNLVIKGTVTWPGLDIVDVEILFSIEEDDIAVNLRGNLASDISLNIPGIELFAINDLAFVFFGASTSSIIKWEAPSVLSSLEGVFYIKAEQGITIPVPIKVGLTESNEWLIEGNFEHIIFPGVNALLVLLSGARGQTNDIRLPKGLDSLTKVALKNITIGFDVDKKNITSFAVEIGPPSSDRDDLEAWEIIPGILALDNYSISLEVYNPFIPTLRSVKGWINATLSISNLGVDIYSTYPKKGEWIFGGNTLEGEKISLTNFKDEILKIIDPSLNFPADFPELYFENLAFMINTGTKELGIKCDANVASIIKVRDKDCSISLGIDINHKPSNVENSLTGKLDGSLSIGEIDFLAELKIGEPNLAVKLDKGSALNFKEVAEFFLGEDLFNELPRDLADNLSGVEVVQFESAIEFEAQRIRLALTTTMKDIRFGTDDLMIPEADLSLKLDVSENRKYCCIQVGGGGSIGPAVIFNECEFIFEYDELERGVDWKLGGLFDAEILGHHLRVAAAFQKQEDVKKLALHAVTPFPPIVFPGVATFSLDEFTLVVERQDKEKVAWALSTTFQFKTEADVFDLRSGTASLINEVEKTGLKLHADGIDMKIQGLEFLPWFTFDQPELDLLRIGANKEWSCHGKIGFIAHNVPDPLTYVFLFEEFESECTINNEKAEFSISPKDGLIRLPAPMDVGDFGHAYIGINKLAIDIKEGILKAKLKFGLPKGLNTVFQPDPNAEDKLEIFRVYDPDKTENREENLLDFSLTISAKEGLSCRLGQSPFKFFEVQEVDGGRKVIDFDLKEFGYFSIDMPEFSLQSDGSLKAAGGFDIKRDLQFPLTPIKYLLKHANLEAAANALPDGIPIKPVKFYTKESGFKCDSFFDLFVQDGQKVVIPAWLEEGFTVVDDIMNRLPSDFREYGNIGYIKHLHFDVDFSVDGSLNFKFSVKDPEGKDDAEPVKILLPLFPSFMGIELYSISLGELFGGALLNLDLDIKVDTFDIPSLLAALLIDYDQLPAEIEKKLPKPQSYQNSFRAENLSIVIVYQAGVPIPIPLFYDELRATYKGLNGIELESAFRFPKPKIDVKEFSLLLTEIKSFLADKEKRIDTTKFGQVISLGNFYVQQNYLRFPKYISTEEKDPELGKLIGTEEGFTISPAKLLGAVLNAIKFGSINDLIQVVEVERRIGEVDLNVFDVLRVHYEYAFTTPHEFIDCAYKELSSFSQNEAQKFIEVLPPQEAGLPEVVEGPYRYREVPVTEETQGLIIYLKGELDVTKDLHFDSGFGLVATGEGFGMGMNFHGYVEKIFDLHMHGAVGINKEGKYLLEGESQLELLKQNIFYGRFKFNNEGLCIEARAGDGPICVSGFLEGEFTNDVFRLEGNVSLVLFTLSAEGKAKFLFANKKELIHLQGNIQVGNYIKLRAELKTFSDLDLQQAGMGLSMYGKLSDLLELDLKGTALHTGTTFQAKGDVSMKIVSHEVILGGFECSDNILIFNGKLNLFPNNELLLIEGGVKGQLNSKQFELIGKSEIQVFGVSFVSTRVMITDREFAFSSQLFKLKTLLLIQKMEGQESGFILYGTMSPIVFGALLRITCAPGTEAITDYDLGGPSIYISNAPTTPCFRLNGRVYLLGITSSSNIFFNKEGFTFAASGKLFDVMQGSITALGKDLVNTNDIFIEGELDTSDFESRAIEGINQAAKAINDQIICFNKKLDDKKRYLEELKAKVRGLDNEINKCKVQINDLKKQIESKKAWHQRLPWYQKPVQLVVLGAFVAVKGLEIAGLYAKIGVLEGAKLAALSAIEVAKAALSGVQLVLGGAGVVTNALADFSKDVLSFPRRVLLIESMTFKCQLNAISTGGVLLDFKGSFFDKPFELNSVRFSLLQPQVGVASLVTELKKIENK